MTSDKDDGIKNEDSNTQTVFDIELMAWRSFKYETLITYETENENN